MMQTSENVTGVVKPAAWGLIVCLIVAGCNSQKSDRAKDLDSVVAAPSTVVAITTFCSACHPMPNPASFAKDRWHHEVRRGIDFYRKSQRTDLVIPDFEATLAWFQQYAPEQYAFEVTTPVSDSVSHPFQRVDIPVEIADQKNELTSISHVVNLSLPGQTPKLAMADMRDGFLWQGAESHDVLRLESFGRVANPAHIEPTDLDGDGKRDFLVADLGGLFPQRTKRGNLWWFWPQPNGQWKRTALRMGMMRVSDVRPIDVDGDGDLDLIVAEFGWHFHGGIHLMMNIGVKDGVPQFESSLLDDRPGAIHLPVIDLNGDGRLDFVALISQHHETVVAFMNVGNGAFRKETIYAAGDPAYGSSGIELVDFDLDGDMDVLMSNGDTFDDETPKPIHSIQWLENEGAFPYRHHRIGQMPGAYRAVAGDVDGDGDMDVAAVALLTEKGVLSYPPGKFDGVVYFEQGDAGQFVRHSLQSGQCNAATCDLIDWDVDGDLDIVVYPYSTSLESAKSITLYRNDR